ncbi:hypothetical protein IWX92DRAFT_354622 [Phyllosticta citricarpa]
MTRLVVTRILFWRSVLRWQMSRPKFLVQILAHSGTQCPPSKSLTENRIISSRLYPRSSRVKSHFVAERTTIVRGLNEFRELLVER